ncbi:MAG TPA: hypothetical protein VN285_01625 [Candidatus Deferrimicrobium sp.]|nr:hypothetical protein [Candidatus Deferrimicrobium sp.]
MTRTLIIALGFVGGLLTNVLSQTFDRFHHPPTSKKLNYDSLYVAAIDLSRSPRGQEIVQSCIERYGGRETLDQLRSFRLTYAMLLMMSRDSTIVVKSYADDRQYKVARQQIGGVEQRILVHDSAWFVGRDTIFAMDKARYCAELFSYLTLSLPKALYTEPFSAMRYGTRAQDTLEYIYCRKNDSLTIIVGIDPDDSCIVSSEGIIQGDSIQTVFVNKFSDFELYDGFLFPRQLVNISMGLEVGRSRLTSADINPAFDADEFRPSRSANTQTTY